MNENQLSDCMNLAVLDEPPLDFDPDEVIDGAVRRRRNLLAVVSGSSAVLVAAAAVALGGTGPQRGQPGVPPPLSPSSIFTPPPSISRAPLKPCPVSLPDVVPPLLAKHFPGVTFKPDPGDRSGMQYLADVRGHHQQGVNVGCATGYGLVTVYPDEHSQPVIDEKRPDGARLLVWVFDHEIEGVPQDMMGQWLQGDELTIQLTVSGSDRLGKTVEDVAALTEEVAELAR